LPSWEQAEKLKPENGGSQSKLTAQQTRALEQHLQEKPYLKVSDICDYVARPWQVIYTVSGMTKWLQTHDFRYKQPKATPAKADTTSKKRLLDLLRP
jgi:transposase